MTTIQTVKRVVESAHGLEIFGPRVNQFHGVRRPVARDRAFEMHRFTRVRVLKPQLPGMKSQGGANPAVEVIADNGSVEARFMSGVYAELVRSPRDRPKQNQCLSSS